MIIQRNRFLHLVMISLIVLLFLFIYSSYHFYRSKPVGILKLSDKIETSFTLNLSSEYTNSTAELYTGPEKPVLTASVYESGHRNSSPLICLNGGAKLKLLIIVNSAPNNQDQRTAIRLTWGHFNMRTDVSIMFFIGRSANPDLEDRLNAEDRRFTDIVRGNSIDSYDNLTLKTISILEWVDRQCRNVPLLLKADDDVFINVPQLLMKIKEYSSKRWTIFGNMNGSLIPFRKKNSKYYVPLSHYPATVYPNYTLGPAYMMTSDIIHDLFTKSLEQNYIKCEDVYITGIVAELLSIKRVHVELFLNKRASHSICLVQNIISIVLPNNSEQFELWDKLFKNSSACPNHILKTMASI